MESLEVITVFLKGVKSFFECLAKAFVKRQPTETKLGMPGIPWSSVDVGILRLRKFQCYSK